MKRAPSLRNSLLLRVCVSTVLVLVMLSVGAYLLVRHGMLRETDSHLRQTAALLSDQIEIEDGHVVFEWQEGQGTNDTLELASLFQFWDERTGETTRSPALGTMDLPKFTGVRGAPEIRSVRLQDGRPARAIGLVAKNFFLPGEMERMQAADPAFNPMTYRHTLVVARVSDAMNRTLQRLRGVLLSGTLFAILLVFTMIDHVVRTSLVPVDRLGRDIALRTHRRLDEPLAIPQSVPREMVDLAHGFNELLARLSALRGREKSFIRSAAHELRTPVAGLLANIEMSLAHERSVEESRAHLVACRDTAMHMGELVARLSAMARLESGVAAGAELRDDVSPCEILSERLAVFLPKMEASGLEVRDSLTASHVRVRTDPTLLRLVFDNLLDNVVSYTPVGGTVVVSCEPLRDGVRAHVKNSVSAPPQDVSKWFDPFYRGIGANDARHFGIGLALCAEAATIMGAEVRARVSDAGDSVIMEVDLRGAAGD